MNGLWSRWDPNRARTFFVYGGYWKARPVSPPGLAENPVFGRSSNQEMLNGARSVELEVDDYVFYRPTQSESVMLQFGDLALVRGGRIVDFWPVFEERA
jgi:D-serine deaminase-like pyridoxal phosphate-dependent protein